MTWIIENPWPAIIVGGIAELALLVKLYTSGRVKVMLWMAVVAAITAGFWFLEQTIVTEPEKVENLLYEMAAAFERNDLKTIEKHISPNSIALLSRAQQTSRLPFEQVRINSDLKVKVLEDADPPQAEATGSVTVKMKTGYKQPMPVELAVSLRKVDGQWLIYHVAEAKVGIR